MAVWYASIFAKKYGTLMRYALFVMVRVWYVGTVRFKIELKYDTLVRYGSRCEVRSAQILNVPYRTAILAYYIFICYVVLAKKRQEIFRNFQVKLQPAKHLLQTQ